MMNAFVESIEEGERYRPRLLFVKLERNRFTRKMDDCLKSIEDNICLPEFLKKLEVGVMGWGNA